MDRKPPNPERPRIITAHNFARTLANAGIIDDRLDSITEIRIVANPSDAVRIEVDYLADERLCGIVGSWEELKQAYQDQMEGRRARLLREELDREVEEAIVNDLDEMKRP